MSVNHKVGGPITPLIGVINPSYLAGNSCTFFLLPVDSNERRFQPGHHRKVVESLAGTGRLNERNMGEI